MTCVMLVRLSRGLRTARHVSKCACKPRARLVLWFIDLHHSGTHHIKARRCARGTSTGHTRH
jgi:hypothetical protein